MTCQDLKRRYLSGYIVLKTRRQNQIEGGESRQRGLTKSSIEVYVIHLPNNEQRILNQCKNELSMLTTKVTTNYIPLEGRTEMRNSSSGKATQPNNSVFQFELILFSLPHEHENATS